MSKVLEGRLAEASLTEAAEAGKIVRLVNESIRMTRELARGLLPVVSEARGLMSALERWALEVSDLFHVSCRFECASPVLVYEEGLAEHLFHMAQEAVNNAITHGKAKNVKIILETTSAGGMLIVHDDGSGFHAASSNQSGLGLRIMNYRAKIIGGTLKVQSVPGEGTMVSCMFPIAPRESGGPNEL